MALSISKALYHAANKAERKLVIEWIESDTLGEDAAQTEAYATNWGRLKRADGVLVPGGFGDRGVEGKIAAARYARENKKPYLGVCLGFQVAVIEFNRTVLGHEGAHSTEISKDTPHPVVLFMPEGSKTQLGGTMRLGSRKTIFQDRQSMACRLYGNAAEIEERHRHRFEVNPDYVLRHGLHQGAPP